MKVQNLGSKHEATPITVNGEVVEAVSSFVYFGSTISSGSNSHSEVMRRIGLASSVIDRLSRIWSQWHLSLTTKCRLYSSCILAVGSSVCLLNVDADESGLEETGILSSALSKEDSWHQVVRLHHECRGLHQIGSAKYPVNCSPPPSLTVRPRCAYAK